MSVLPGWLGATRRLGGPMRRALRGVEALALPQRCPGCGVDADPRRFLCASCLARIPRLETPLCVRCLVRERDPSACSAHPGYRAWVGRIYDERVARMIHAFKFEGRRALAPLMASWVAESLPIHYRPDGIVEVPLHPARLRERGYNQASLLADSLASLRGVPHLSGCLERVRATPPQTGLAGVARRRNLAEAFAVGRPERLEGREVLIVDDVMTTGSTLEACLEILKSHGIRAQAAAVAWAA